MCYKHTCKCTYTHARTHTHRRHTQRFTSTCVDHSRHIHTAWQLTTTSPAWMNAGTVEYCSIIYPQQLRSWGYIHLCQETHMCLLYYWKMHEHVAKMRLCDWHPVPVLVYVTSGGKLSKWVNVAILSNSCTMMIAKVLAVTMLSKTMAVGTTSTCALTNTITYAAYAQDAMVCVCENITKQTLDLFPWQAKDIYV